jgi:hypothetical protein
MSLSCLSSFPPSNSNSNFARGTVTGGIPEPATWALMLFGFGLLGGAGYWTRRRSIAVAA